MIGLCRPALAKADSDVHKALLLQYVNMCVSLGTWQSLNLPYVDASESFLPVPGLFWTDYQTDRTLDVDVADVPFSRARDKEERQGEG